METGKSVNICLLKYSQSNVLFKHGKEVSKTHVWGEILQHMDLFFIFWKISSPHLAPYPMPEIKVLREIIPFQLEKGHFDGEVLGVKKGHFHCSFCLLRNGSVPFNPTHTQWNHS